ncbi:hypothetical protein [Streptomyces syringium]|uniref:hypothetical protein n=1 Tax=Streptomyces syringium TaxID=76729 RepID=UPI0033C90CE1
MERERGTEVVQQYDAWTVRMWWPEGPVTGGPQRITIEAADDAAPGEVSRGISTTVLRRADLVSAKAEARAVAPKTEGDDAPLALLGPAVRSLLASEGVSPSYLVVLASIYTAMADSGATAFVPELSKYVGRSLETVRGHLKQARRDGYLTTVAGKAGGELTDEARAIFDALDLEALGVGSAKR